ncbi:MCE family protein [Fodinicola acaciae]|uniref:MCE family protein n=1 Tax=Fodinicola acaciae TaxID=2681555 RepID=UPI0013D628B1|nr:MCE family protein [Fodinicola acaciae]
MRRLAAFLATAALLLGGCGLSFQNLPLTQAGGSSYALTAVFTDAAQLPLGGQVRIGQAVVGRVTSLHARDFQAVVGMRIDSGTRLPVGTTARLELTSVLGEEYVLLVPPERADRGFLADTATIGIDDTSRAPDVENTLAAVGALLSGSGLDQVRTIVTETNRALAGHEQQVRTLLGQLDTLLRSLDAHKDDINRTITALNTFAAAGAGNRATLQAALTHITPALDVLLGQRTEFTALLVSISRLAKTTTGVLSRTSSGIVARAKQLQPVLSSLASFDSELGSTLMSLRTFQQLLGQTIPGDYLTLDATLDVSGTVAALLSGGGRIAPSAPTGRSSAGGVGGLLSGGLR